MGVEFKKMDPAESAKLREALRNNAERGTPLQMDALTTGWKPDDYEPSDQACIDAIRSVPCHYSVDTDVTHPEAEYISTELEYIGKQLELIRAMCVKAPIVLGCVERTLDALKRIEMKL